MLVDDTSRGGFESGGKGSCRLREIGVDEPMQFGWFVAGDARADCDEKLRLPAAQVLQHGDQRGKAELLLPQNSRRRMFSGAGEVAAVARALDLCQSLRAAADCADSFAEGRAPATSLPLAAKRTRHDESAYCLRMHRDSRRMTRLQGAMTITSCILSTHRLGWSRAMNHNGESALPTAALRRLQATLESRATDRSREFWRQYLRGHASFRGVPMAGVRETVHDWWQAEGFGELSMAAQRRIALRLFQEDPTEDKLAGVLLLSETLLPNLSAKDLPAFGRLFTRGLISDWNLCDCWSGIRNDLPRQAWDGSCGSCPSPTASSSVPLPGTTLTTCPARASGTSLMKMPKGEQKKLLALHAERSKLRKKWRNR